MMTICDIQIGNLTECLDETHRIGNTPDRMLNSVLGRKVEKRVGHGRFHDHSVDFTTAPISQKHWSSLGLEDQHVPSAIVFFVATRAFVLANDVLVVLID